MSESMSEATSSKVPLLFLALLIISVIASFALEGRLVKDVFLHLGGLSIVGLFACLAGYIARKKGRDYRTALVLGISLPVILGAVAASVVFLSTGFVYCGGGVVLVAALIVVVVYACLRKRAPAIRTAQG